jgi:hypothetical protein
MVALGKFENSVCVNFFNVQSIQLFNDLESPSSLWGRLELGVSDALEGLGLFSFDCASLCEVLL